MGRLRITIINGLANLAPRYLPFADVATPDLPLSRLLRLSLFQVTTGMALVLLVGTLNRVMIVELGVPASLVGIGTMGFGMADILLEPFGGQILNLDVSATKS